MKKLSAPAIIALKDALTAIYWYKSDLKSFLNDTIANKQVLSYLNWDDYKRNISSYLVDLLIKNEENTQDDLLKLVYTICDMNDFSHLRRIEDGIEKEKIAKETVLSLRNLSKGHLELIKEKQIIENRRKKVFEEQLEKTAVIRRLDDLKNEFYLLVSSSDHQKRGYQLEKLLKNLFNLFDLDPKASFKTVGEQIDGMFTFDNNDFLIEAKWHKDPIDISSLDAFSGKLSRRLENTLGLFISINGFSPDAIQAHSTGRRLMILMDGNDLVGVLEGRIDLIQLLTRKRRYAAMTGNIYLGIKEIMEGK